MAPSSHQFTSFKLYNLKWKDHHSFFKQKFRAGICLDYIRSCNRLGLITVDKGTDNQTLDLDCIPAF